MSAHSCHRASLCGSVSGRQIPVWTLSSDRPNIPKENHHAAPLRRFRAIAATARATLNAAATKAKIDSGVTADGSQNRAIKSFPAQPVKACAQFYPKCIVGREVMRVRKGASQTDAKRLEQLGRAGAQACMIIEPALRNHRQFARSITPKSISGVRELTLLHGLKRRLWNVDHIAVTHIKRFRSLAD